MTISQAALKKFVANYEPFSARTVNLEQRIQIGTGFHGKWYRSQREHWLGWLEFQDRAARLNGKSPDELKAGSV